MQEAKVAPIIKQVCDAVNEIHSLRIIHRDIKPENIVIHDVLALDYIECHQTLRFRMVSLSRQQAQNNILRHAIVCLPVDTEGKGV